MLAVLFLLVTSLAGFAAATRVLPEAPAIVRVPAGFLLAIVFASWTTYLVAAGLSGLTDESLRIGIVVSTLLGAVALRALRRSLRPAALRVAPVEAVIAALSLVLSTWLIQAHLRRVDGELMVSSNTWGDTGLHVALSRSFSVGANYPTQYPFFAGEPIRYHFGFDFFAGALQAGGLPVQWSFNLPAVLGLTAMMLVIFATARLLFSAAGAAPRWWRDRAVWIGIVAVVLLVTNQSMGWRRYVAADGGGSLLTALRPSVWWNHQQYLSAGPYTEDPISIFNTLNPYLAQTHLIVASALFLVLIYAVLWQLREDGAPDRRVLGAIGVVFGLAFWQNGVAWIASAIFVAALLVIWALAACRRAARDRGDESRWAAARGPGFTWLRLGAWFAVPALVLGVPQAVILSGGEGLSVHLGYLVCSAPRSSCHGGQMNPLSLADWGSFVEYWWLNLGVFGPLLILAFLLGSRRDKKIIAATTALFIWGSIFNVGADIGGHNHKLFNLWENLAGLFVAFALVQIWVVSGRLLRRGPATRAASGVAGRVLAVGLAVLLVVSGLIDFMTIKNDPMTGVFGSPATQQATEWIAEETPKRSVFLTDYDQLYSAPTMAGRRVALGYSPWASTSGYDVEPRQQLIVALYSAGDRPTFCSMMRAAGLDYAVLGPQERTSTRFTPNTALFSTLQPEASFGADADQTLVYSVARNC